MAGRYFFIAIPGDLQPFIIMSQIIGAFINQLVHGGVGFQIYTDCKVIGQLALKVCHKEAATAKDIEDTQWQAGLNGLDCHIQVDFAQVKNLWHFCKSLDTSMNMDIM